MVKNRLLGTTKLEEQYSVHVEFMVTELFLKDGCYNIFHATIKGDPDDNGSPGIWIRLKNGQMFVYVYSEVGGDTLFTYSTPFDPLQLNKWVIIDVSQTKVAGGYQNTVKMNGNVVYTENNTNTRQSENMKIYITDPWYSAVPGYVRNVYLTGKV